MPDSNIPAVLFKCRRHPVGLVTPSRPAVREGLLVVRRVNRPRDAELCKLTEPLSLRVRANDYLKNGLLAFIEKHAPEWTGR